MSAHRLGFGFSPCPNDTFAFWAAVHGEVPMRGLELVPELLDIEALNRRATTRGEVPLALTKLSLPALAAASRRYAVLPAGAALGFGVGPLVVRRGEADEIASLQHLRGRRVAIPGRHTTAFLLLSLFAPRDCEVVEVRFDEVMPLVARGECDAGLVIHEGRFTFAQHGMVALADLGELWERRMQLPLPLGVIALRRDLGAAVHRAAGEVLRDSVRFSFANPEAPRAWIREHAQELDDEVCDRHVRLYVNDFTVDLGERGRAAIDELLRHGRALGLLADGPPPWREDA